MKKLVLLLALFSLAEYLPAQRDLPIHIGYYAPYGVQYGAKVGVSAAVWESEGNRHVRQLQLNPQLGYFTYPDVQKNFLVNAELVYRQSKPDRRFYKMASLGFGYLLAAQRQGVSVNLGSGESTADMDYIHHLLPTISLGLGQDPKRVIGWYAKAFYGRKIGLAAADETFLGVELGLTFNL